MKTQKLAGVPGNNGIQFEESILVDLPAGQLFNFWRDFRNLPKFMSILKSVDILEHGITRWHVDGPFGMNISWDAEIINEQPDRLIAWQSLGDPQVSNAGSVRFIAINEDRTEVRISAQYDPPGGEIGMAIIALLLEDPERQIKDDLARFKYYVEEQLPLAA
ncbi:MAG: SRPBCC family protein [Verrucomicrobiota bacterium]